MPRYDDRHGTTRLYVGRLSARTRSRDLEDIFSRYGRVRDVDMKRDYAFVEFSDPRDADDARYSLNGREVDGSRIIVEAAKGVPRGPGGSRDRDRGGDRGDYPGGRGPPPGTGRCFNCGIDGHWARDCKAGDWKNKCYRCGERGHIERNCQNSPQKLNDSRSPSPRRDRRDRSFSRSRSYSRSRSPVRRERSIDLEERRSRSPKRQRAASPPLSRGRNRSLTPERSPRERGTPSPRDGRAANGSEYSRSPVARNRSPKGVAGRDDDMRDRSPVAANGRGRSPSRSRSPIARGGSPADDYNGSPRGSE